MRSARKKMVRQLETCSNVEVRGTVRFLWAKRFTSTEIHSEISAMSRPAIVKWCQQFEDGRTDLTDAKRQRRPATVSKHIGHGAAKECYKFFGAAGGRHYSQQWQE
ncbi:hypothetical protein AVEN_17615-1 [Araneus ventricosus]|uniref:Mos1 transposase HTH domain-containing protein n=1 Tax=Araneus ventricosus TaxID=182803 RepID=A0A4Y2VF06_ARAVE|nr:hypothetical protein AVEN_17615-1 [Araneus ventricosus]